MQIFKTLHARARREHLHWIWIFNKELIQQKTVSLLENWVPTACARQFMTAEDSSQEAVEAAFP